MLSLYVHVPFCLRKCDYCAFFSVPYAGSELAEIYLQGVEQEIEMRLKEAPAGVSSLFLGGGTPTVLAAGELDALLKSLSRFRFTAQAEKTSEANPGTLDLKKLDILQNHGINRISLGVQSFNDLLLQRIGRIHSAEEVYHSVKLIRASGIDNLNLDLMFGLPGQTITDWQETLKRAVAIGPEHLSVYGLTLEPGTPLYNRTESARLNFGGSSAIPDDDLQADMYEYAAGYLSDQGYLHYEIANFARQGYECRHNLSYWQGEDYLGLGPGAVSCLGGVRCQNIEEIQVYHRQIQAGTLPLDPNQTEILTEEQRISEYIMLGLRTAKGIDAGLFAQKFGKDIQDIYGSVLTKYNKKKMIWSKEGKFGLNPAYFFVANSIIRDFIL